MIMSDETRKNLHELLDLILDINESGKSEAFMTFSGHVNVVTIQAFTGGWSYEKDADLQLESSLKHPEFHGKIAGDFAPDTLVKKLKEYRKELER